MEAQQNIPANGVIRSKPRKKKPVLQSPKNIQPPFESLGGAHEIRSMSSKKGHKSSKRGPMEDVSHVFRQEKSIPDSLPGSSVSETEYRALRRKYLILGKELKEVEDSVNALEEEKLALLDELVVLEGLVDPSELQPHGQKFH